MYCSLMILVTLQGAHAITCNSSTLEMRQLNDHLFVLFSQAAVTIYVAYDGIVKELMYEVDDVATAGQPLLTIELAEEQDEDEGE